MGVGSIPALIDFIMTIRSHTAVAPNVHHLGKTITTFVDALEALEGYYFGEGEKEQCGPLQTGRFFLATRLWSIVTFQ